MSKPKVTLWLLNRAVNWDHRALVDALSPRFEVKLGRRVATRGEATELPVLDLDVNKVEPGAPGELMHEGKALPPTQAHGFDEYFVPIPKKCLGEVGSPFWKRVQSSEGEDWFQECQRHQAMRDASTARDPFADKVKDGIDARFGEVKMNLRDEDLGYYELLQRSKEAHGANILVGYSQGGTVARYLAFLDEQVVKPEYRCIHAVITVQAPNRGSPVASPEKQSDVSRALVAILLSISQWLPPRYEASTLWGFLRDHSILEFIFGFLDAQLDSLPAGDHKRHLLLTARKWLSGLAGLPELAFWDLDPARAAQEGSVLHAIAHHPLTSIQHGAVIGANGRILDAIRTGADGASLKTRVLLWLLVWRLSRSARQMNEIYRTGAMSFPKSAPGDLVDFYEKGMQKVDGYGLSAALPERAHDLVIPSASQLLFPAADHPRAHLGNLVNPRANHLSGTRLDEALALKLLRQVKPRTAEAPGEARLPAAA